MGYKVKDVVGVIEDFAPVSIQEGWDNSGLCIGSPDSPVSSVLLGLDCTPELVDEAVACGADMIVTHHPLIFSGLKKISPDDQVGAAVIKAVSNGISVYAAHTSADKVISGVSGARSANGIAIRYLVVPSSSRRTISGAPTPTPPVTRPAGS